MCGASLTQWIVLGVVEDWLCRGGRGGGVVAMVAVFGGDGRQVVGVGAVGAGVVVTVHPSGGGGLEVVAAPPGAAAPAARAGHPGPFCRVPRWPPGPPGIPPAPASKRLAPRGRGSPSRSRGGVRHDLLEGGRDRAARVTWTGPVLHPDPVRTVRTRRGPRSSSPALVDALGGSAAGALTLRRHRASRRAPPDLAPRPARPPRHRLPGAPGRVAGPRAAPRRVPGLAPAFAHAQQTPPRPLQDGPGRPGTNRSHIV